MLKPLKVIYKNTVLTSNGTIEGEGINSPSIIIFHNQGTSIAYVSGNVKIFPGDSWQLKNDPGIVLENSFTVTFDTSVPGLENNLAVIRGYYKE